MTVIAGLDQSYTSRPRSRLLAVFVKTNTETKITTTTIVIIMVIIILFQQTATMNNEVDKTDTVELL